ncbi:MAG: phosphoglucosamine mutase [Elusimicrobia bacterium]|nr:phosphoglucosamine mutase [Elusimicrobiota bacterium]
MKERLFGTDGVRGIPGKPPLTPQTIRSIARSAAGLLLRRRTGANGSRPPPANGRCAAPSGTAVPCRQPFVVVGRDTRASGPALCRELVAGFSAAGCRTVDLGVVPTPAVSYLASRLGALAGVTVSASHNPAEFNGIKFFMGSGLKMPESLEAEVEALVARSRPEALDCQDIGGPGPRGLQEGRWPKGARPVQDGRGFVERYRDFLRSVFPAHLDLSGMRIVADCAHGAAADIAPAILEGLGARVVRIGCSPRGSNINKGCGALETEAMRRAVLKSRAHAGVSFDGDADRAIFCDERGRIADGDALIGLAALRLRRLGLLRGDKVVVTIMTNLGLIKFLEEVGIASVVVPVGDRNVADAIEAEGLSLGGEASGHVIFRCFAPTGDGIVTALETLAAVRESGRPFSLALPAYRVFPQLLKNIPVSRKVPVKSLPHFLTRVRSHSERMKGYGRIVARYSGTEPLFRIMVEGPSAAQVRRVTADLTRVYLHESRNQRRIP